MELSREEWLQQAAELIVVDILADHCTVRDNLEIKTSVGYAPNTRTDSNVIGVCLASHVSEAGYNEIFISPAVSDSMEVLAVLVHEVIHAIDDCKSGHTGAFKRIARAAGLVGDIYATQAGDELKRQLSAIVSQLGPIPHAKVNLNSLPRQKNRNLKVFCECGFKFNTSRTQIMKVLTAHGEIQCPHCFKSMDYDV